MNPIRARLRKHAAGGYGKIDDYEADLHKIYLHARMRIEDQLERFMADKRSSFTGPRLVKLMEEIQEIFPEFEEQYRETYEHALSYMAKKNYQQALYDMGLDEPVYGKLDKSLYENMRDDGFEHIAGATRNMEKEIVSNLRKMSAQVMREAALTGETRAAVSRRLAFANQYGSGSIFQRPGNRATFVFRDAANREWKTDTYFKMLGRTLLHNNSRETYIAACAKEGNDIVTVSISGNPCEHCRQWENRLLSISGKTPGIPTLQSAMSSGLFHPNCTHRIVAVPESVAKRYYDAQGKPVEEEKTEKTDILASEKMKNILGDSVKITPLTSEEKKAISDYTSGDNELINKFLYRNKSETLEDLQEIQRQIKNIDEAINKCELQSDIAVWRGTWEEPRLPLIQKGFNNIPMPGFQSCSVDLSEAQKKARNYPDQSIIYKIIVPKGSHAMPVNDAAGSAYPAEREVLLKSGGSFEILQKPYPELENGKKTGRLVIEVIYHEKKKNEHS